MRRSPPPQAGGSRRCTPESARRTRGRCPSLGCGCPFRLEPLDQPRNVGGLERLAEIVPGPGCAAAGLVVRRALGGDQDDWKVGMKLLGLTAREKLESVH